MPAFLRTLATPRKRVGESWFLLGLFVCACFAGASCSSAPKEEPSAPPVASNSKPPEGVSPDENLYEQLRSGSFQLTAAAVSVEDTLAAAKESLPKLKAHSDAKSAMEDAIDFLNSAGEGLVEFGDDPPAKEAVQKDFAAFDDRRLKAIEAANDSLHDLREALGVLESLSSHSSSEVSKTAIQVKALLAVAIDDVWGAIEALGGEPEASEEPLHG